MCLWPLVEDVDLQLGCHYYHHILQVTISSDKIIPLNSKKLQVLFLSSSDNLKQEEQEKRVSSISEQTVQQ